MAGRVNTKFVITLSAVLVLVFGGLLGAALWIKLHNAPDLAKKGDARMESGRGLLKAGRFDDAQKEFEAAEKLYSKAVYKEQMNPFYVEKWLESLREWVPETQSRSMDAFRQRIVPALRMVAVAKKTDLAAHREYLDLLYQLNRMGLSRAGVENLVSEVDRTLLFYKGDPEENGKARVLRRYRGLIVKAMMQNRGMELTPEQMDLALEDLRAAYEADPTDAESGVAISEWYDARARMARTNNRPREEIEVLDTKSLESIETLAKDHPDDTLISLRSLMVRVASEQKKIREANQDPVKALDADLALAVRFKSNFQRVSELVKARSGSMTFDELAVFQQLEAYFEREGRLDRSVEVLRAMIQEHPDRPDAYYALAQLLSSRDDIPASKALLQQIVDMPPKPAGLDALKLYDKKGSARYLQAVYAFQQWEAVNSERPGSDEANALLAESRKYRADMEQYVGSDSELLRFVDGLHRFSEGDWLGAKKLLTEYNRRTDGQEIKADWTLAQCEIRLRNFGAALEILDRIIRARPDLPGPVVTRAALLNDMGRPEEGIRGLESFLLNQPDNAQAKETLNRIKISAGKATPTDPVEAARIEASRLMIGSATEPPDPGAAEDRIARAVQEASNPQLAEMLASIRLQRGDLKGAIEALEQGLSANPGNQALARSLAGLKSDDPITWSIAQIDGSKDLSDLDKLFRKQDLWMRAAETARSQSDDTKADAWQADADAALDAAWKLAPDDQRVVDRAFQRALSKRDWARAEQMVERASLKDYDRVGGAMYKGRLLYARGQVSEAAGVLREAADKGIADVASLRLLAIIYQQLGRLDEAETFYKEAIKLRPTDATTQVLYLTLLRNSGRDVEALAKAKEAEPTCRTSPEFLSMLLSLESAVGKTQDALDRRKAIYEKNPRNVTNTLALIGLYLDNKQWKEARAALDELRKIGDGTDYALADARWYSDRGDFEGAQKAMTDFISRQDAKKLSSDLFVSLGRFLIERKRYPEGIEMMQRGEPFQDPKVMEVDRAIAETLIEIGQPDVAAVALRRIVDAGADGERQEVRIRLAEILAAEAVRTGNRELFEAADKQLSEIKPQADTAAQMQVMLVRADVAHGLKDNKRAGELFNQAAVQFPTEPMVYLRRAQFHLTRGQEGATDALQDLDAALRVRPNFWQARQLRSFVYLNLGGEENNRKALEDVKEALRTNPSLDDLRIRLLNELITRDRSAEAAEVADSAARARPNDVPLVMSMGQVFAQAGDWSRAVEYYRLGWNRSMKQRIDVAQTLLSALLNVPEPNLPEAEEVLRDVQKIAAYNAKGEKADPILSNWGLLLARAKLHMKRGRSQDAIRDVVVSMTAISANPALPPTADQIGQWSGEVERMFPRGADVLALLERRDIPAPFHEWSRYLRAKVLMDNPATRTQAGAALDEILVQVKTPDVRRLSFRMRGTIEFLESRYDQAEAVWHKGVSEFSDDWELNNNLSYVLARYLDRPKEALPFGEATAKAAPAVAEAVDTYGYVLLRNNRFAEAEVEFKKALSLTRNDQTRASVLLHLIRCLLDQNRNEDARVQIAAVRKLMDKDPAVAAANKAEFDELNRRAGSP